MKRRPLDFPLWVRTLLLSILLGAATCRQASAIILETLSSNAINAPAYIIDQHAADGDPTTLRNGLFTEVGVEISRSILDPAVDADYRVIYTIYDSAGAAVNLDNGGISSSPILGASPSFHVSLSGVFSTLYTDTVSIYPDPAVTLDSKDNYFVRASLQRRPPLGFFWTTVAGSLTDSSPEEVFHFTQAASGDAEWNIRATVADLQWDKRHLLDSDPTDNAFQASVDVDFARYDDWDLPIALVNSTLTLDFDLIEDSTGNQVPLENDGIVSGDWFANSYKSVGLSKIPVFNSVSTTASLRPLVQLTSASETYILRCTVKHIEDVVPTETVDATCELAAVGLLHFNGNLHFGPIAALFDELGNSPGYGATGAGFVSSSIRIPNGHGSLPLNSSYVFGNNALLLVQLLDNGDATLVASSQTVFGPLAPADPVTHTAGNVTYTFGPVVLSATGMTTNSISVGLPQGLIYLPDTTISSHHGEDILSHAAAITMDGTVNIASALAVPLNVNAGIVDESHPLRIGVEQVTLTPSGELVFSNISSHEYIHDDALTQLENDLTDGKIDAFDSAGRRLDRRSSNDHYWRRLNNIPSGQVAFIAVGDKSARMTADFDIAAQAFKAHFPVDAEMLWTTDAYIAIDDGVAAGTLADVVKVDISYHQTCPEDPCSDTVPKFDFEFNPGNIELAVTPTGGLYAEGALIVGAHLAWGARGDGGGAIDPGYPYAHRTAQFAAGDFFMPGYQLYADDNKVLTTAPYMAAGGDNAPATLLLSGFNGDAGSPEIHMPTESEYDFGDGHYPGLNFVVQNGGDFGASRLGGNQFDYPYELLDGGSSKYYTRCAGVFGRQVGVDGSFNPSLNIYGYDFELNSFQLSFKASEPHESWINGAVAVTGHSDFTQQFLGLNLNCLGELEDATMDPSDTSDKQLVYWNSTFVPKSLRFEKELSSVPGACPLEYKGFLTMGITTRVAHVDKDLHGIFGFEAADGNLLTQTSGAGVGIDGELGLPAGISMSGPSHDYKLMPTGKLRFSNPHQNPAAVIGNPGGWVTFGATVDVPYFRDFQVQVMTSANDTPAAPLYLTPGWSSAGETFFSSKIFDPDHVGWPKGAISIAEFQVPDESTAGSFLIKAEQDLFGLVPLSYPMQWNDTTRTFKSMTPNHGELIVIELDHQVDYLDADATKISFGAKYDGLPEINLSSMLNSQIDAAAQSVSDALTVPLKDALDAAFAEFEDFLADSLDAVIDPVIDKAAEEVLCPFYDDVEALYNTARSTDQSWSAFKADLDTAIAARIYDTVTPTAATDLSDQLVKISQVTGDAASMTEDLKDAIEKIIIGIDVIINEVELDGSDIPVFNVDPATIVSGSSGLLKKSLGGEREIIQNLVAILLESIVEPEVKAIITPLLADLSSEINSELNALLVEVDPVLDQIVDALTQVRVFLVEVHTIVDARSDFIADFDALVTQAAAGGFQSIMDKPATRALAFIQDIAQNNGIAAGTDLLNTGLNLFEEFDKDDFVLALKTELKDAILQSDLMQQFQFIVRQTLYDFQMKFEQTVSSVLAQITGVMKEVISETIGALEDQINPLLGDVNDVMGAGEVSGYAEINGDSLRKLRLDASMQFKIPDEMELNVFLEIISYTSEDASNGCVDAGDKTVEVTVGATDVPFDWISDDLRASLSVKMSLKDKGSGLRPNGVGGAFELTGGEISFETFKITCFAATLAVGLDDCYLGARACGVFNSYEISIGIFFGKTCTDAPLILVDADVASILNGNYPLIGAYVYGEVWLPISELVLGIPATCFFNISAGVGTGVGFFVDGGGSPVFVGKMFVGVSGEALCVVSIKGEVTMVGIVQNGSFSASGTGKLTGKAGWCPFCVKFSASAKVSYSDGDWDLDY